MDSKQRLYYALGIMSYSIAKADGRVQQEEKDELERIVQEGLDHAIDFDYCEIIFKILQKDNPGFYEVQKWALDALEDGKYHFNADLKAEFIDILNKVAEAFPPSTAEEKNAIEKFISDINSITVNNTID